MAIKKAEYVIDNKATEEVTERVNNKDSKFNALVTSHFIDKLALNVVQAEKEVVRDLIISKLKVDTDVDTYTEYDFGGNGLIAITPAYSTRNFEAGKYIEFLKQNELFEKAKKLHIVKVSKNEFSTRTNFDKETTSIIATSNKLSVLGAKRADLALSKLIDSYLGISLIGKTLKDNIDNRMIDIIKLGKKKFGVEGLANTKVVCIGSQLKGGIDFKGSISFKCEDKIEIDKERAYELVPDSFTPEEKKAVLKSGSRTVLASVIKIINKSRKFHDKKETEPNDYNDIEEE